MGFLINKLGFFGLETFESSFVGSAKSVAERVSFGFIVNVKNFFIGSLIILSAEINVGCASVIVAEWVGSFIMGIGASILFVCCMTFELVSKVIQQTNNMDA